MTSLRPLEGGSPFRVGAEGMAFAPGADTVPPLGDAPAMALDEVLDADFLAMIRAAVARPFEKQGLPGKYGSRWVEPGTQPASRALRMALSRPGLLAWLERVSNRGPLAPAEGEIAEYRDESNFLDWHDDQHQPSRRLGLTINLSDAPFEGGTFEMRHVLTGEPLLSHHHDRAGSALLFRVRRKFEHRVLPVTKGGPRLVFAGSYRIMP